ncbi:phosphatidic acid phosphatase type 2/haloperoxidase [Lipomyces chichibuensis]|uniref:phosphatidic acid phosphatase type 2/haloperoxidase n=1 Tax=Lipomyces chichibuensis TaxID=1546026 RepID=UPI0033440075
MTRAPVQVSKPMAALADNVDGYETVNFKDAGNRSRDHYKSSMVKSRFRARQLLLPLVRWETPRLAWIQQHTRSQFLDDYFALTANLGTHTFFVIMLPMPFWLGYAYIGRGLVYVLAAGVLISGMMKDFFCLPRPLSPPLHRITMSGSAALEYGFPSTHTTNAVSAALMILYNARENPDFMSPFSLLLLRILMWIYMGSIVLGRIYCGMHGFLDVIAGAILGALIFYLRWTFGDAIDQFMTTPGLLAPCVITPIMLTLVRVHPEPVDPCPCFEDGVAFAGVVLGVDLALWHGWGTPFMTAVPYPGYIPYSYAKSGIVKSFARVALGIVTIFVWRAAMKKTLHAVLPPLFRLIEKIGLSMPREFFLKASEYHRVPSSIPDSTLVGAREIPSLIHNITRMRSDSVGPQSPADMYETIAYREERQRRKSLEIQSDTAHTVETNDGMDELDEDQLFLQIPKPRVQYDVEVITKLIVYAGIGWIAVEGCAWAFYQLGL